MPESVLVKIEEALKFIRVRSKLSPQIGLTLGSGLSSFADQVESKTIISFKDIPHFASTKVEGHPGQLVLGHIGKRPVAILQGRIHFYEGHSLEQVVFPTRVLARLGIHTLVLTNAAGGIGSQMRPGDFMILKDHINLTGTNPLIGANISELGPRFPDMSQPYDPTLIQKLKLIFKKKKSRHSVGVYCGVTGPSYETPAEIRFFKAIGAHAVGMSTVAETIAARHLGVRVCGISCITNLAAGLSRKPLSHEEVKEVAKKVETQFGLILTEFVSGLEPG